MLRLPVRLRIREADYVRKSVGIHVEVLAFEDSVHPLSQTSDRVVGRLQFSKSLVGRGQPGFAGFFKDVATQVEYLIKEDTPDTCVLEGSARFSQELLPELYGGSVNYARAGSLEVVGGKGEAVDAVAISVQLRVLPSRPPETEIVPWDVIVYGRKRNPKTLFSEESSHAKEILQNISLMSSKAQWDLACGIFISAVVGDESLHVGQFMAEREVASGRVVGLTRIDFGARERYADVRMRDRDFKHTTSKAYSSSGQKGKHYVDYLLASPGVKRKYALLWESAAETDFKALARWHTKVLDSELKSIPPSLMDGAVADVWRVLQRKFKGSSPKSMDELGRHVAEVTYRRLSEMTNNAALSSLKQPLAELERKQKATALSPGEHYALSEWHLCQEELRAALKEVPIQPFYLSLLSFAFLNHMLAEMEVYRRKTGGQKVEAVNRAMGVIGSYLASGVRAEAGGNQPHVGEDLSWLDATLADEISPHRSRSLMHRAEHRTDLSQGARLINDLLVIQGNYVERRGWAAIFNRKPHTPSEREHGVHR